MEYAPALPLPEEGKSLLAPVLCRDPTSIVVTRSGCSSRVMAKQADPAPGLTDLNQFPRSNAWELCWLRHPCFFCASGNMETPLSHLQFCFSSTFSVFQAGKSYRSRFLKVLILSYGAISLCGSQLMEDPSRPLIIFLYIPSDSLFCTSYFAKSGCFSICRIPVILFLCKYVNTLHLRFNS